MSSSHRKKHNEPKEEMCDIKESETIENELKLEPNEINAIYTAIKKELDAFNNLKINKNTTSSKRQSGGKCGHNAFNIGLVSLGAAVCMYYYTPFKCATWLLYDVEFIQQMLSYLLQIIPEDGIKYKDYEITRDEVMYLIFSWVWSQLQGILKKALEKILDFINSKLPEGRKIARPEFGYDPFKYPGLVESIVDSLCDAIGIGVEGGRKIRSVKRRHIKRKTNKRKTNKRKINKYKTNKYKKYRTRRS
jgi:hypothetical protein